MVRLQESSQGGVFGNRVIGLRLEISCFSSFVSLVDFDQQLSLRSRCLVEGESNVAGVVRRKSETFLLLFDALAVDDG